jgi:hypothetical protein
MCLANPNTPLLPEDAARITISSFTSCKPCLKGTGFPQVFFSAFVSWESGTSFFYFDILRILKMSDFASTYPIISSIVLLSKIDLIGINSPDKIPSKVADKSIEP